MTDGGDLHGPRDRDGRSAGECSNEELVADFQEHVEASTKESTARFYARNLRPFVAYVADRGGHLTADVGARDVEAFLRSEADDLAPKTVGHRYSAISRFYSVLRDRLGLLPADKTVPIERVEKDAIAGLSEKTVAETHDGEAFHYLTPAEVGELIEHVPAPDLRNRALLTLMTNTGARASEAIRVRIGEEYLNLDEKWLRVKSPKLSDDIENDPEWIDLFWRGEQVSDVLDAYCSFERSVYPDAATSPYLFPSKQSERLGYSQLRRIIHEAAEAAGLQDVVGQDAAGNDRYRVGTHTLRHSWAMAALDEGMHIDEIRDNLHHSDVSVTMKYLRRHEEDRKRAVEQHGPQFG